MRADAEFWDWLEARTRDRSERTLAELVASSGGPEKCVVIVVDMVEGFCRVGPLSSPRIGALIAPTVEFLTRCHEAGLRDFLFPCDAHPADSVEFEAFPPHCVEGTLESQLVSEIAALPFANLFERFDKRSVSSIKETGLVARLRGDDFQTFICVGDCTDLCLYHLATGLHYLAVSSGHDWDIVVPADLVATYDLPVAKALALGALPHPGDLMHSLFLYHLELNGISVVSSLP